MVFDSFARIQRNLNECMWINSPFYDVLLTVHLSTILVINQLDAQNLVL